MFELVSLNLVRSRRFSVCHFLAFVLDVFLGDSFSLCLLSWNVEVFLLCPLSCIAGLADGVKIGKYCHKSLFSKTFANFRQYF